jgi:hypothetical protein
MNTTAHGKTPRETEIVQALILQGVDYATAEDKAFMTYKGTGRPSCAEAAAHAGLEATVKALALVLGTDEGHANELILSATD